MTDVNGLPKWWPCHRHSPPRTQLMPVTFPVLMLLEQRRCSSAVYDGTDLPLSSPPWHPSRALECEGTTRGSSIPECLSNFNFLRKPEMGAR